MASQDALGMRNSKGELLVAPTLLSLRGHGSSWRETGRNVISCPGPNTDKVLESEAPKTQQEGDLGNRDPEVL